MGSSRDTGTEKNTALVSLEVYTGGGAMLDIRSDAGFQKTGGQRDKDDGFAVPVNGPLWYFVLEYLQTRVRQEG